MGISRRQLLGRTSAILIGSALPIRAARAAGPRFTPEMFGAKGDGRANDSKAFARLAAAVNRAGGGVIDLRRVTYIVGEQTRAVRADAPWAYTPAPLLELKGCKAPLTIRGNGARLKCAPGLRYGIFDPVSEQPVRTKMPYLGSGVSSPYWAMIRIEDCAGPVQLSDLELDGNLDQLSIGGEYGDTGRQIAGSGLILANNKGSELIVNLRSHHHGQDGLVINGLSDDGPRRPSRRIVGLRSEYNGRQGCSIVGGRGYVFERCSFSHTGRSRVSSAPGAGVDIEAEGGKTNRDFVFRDCQFSDNEGCGMVADTGDSEGALFERCTFIGTTAWSVWPNKPRFLFRNCRFVGAIVRTYGDPDAARAAKFFDCTFLDEPSLSPTGRIYLQKPDGPIADLSDTQNVLFSRCRFLLTGPATLPWSVHVIYADCTMEQKSRSQAYPRGTFVGSNSITGNVDLYGSKFRGPVTINGKTFPPNV